MKIIHFLLFFFSFTSQLFAQDTTKYIDLSERFINYLTTADYTRAVDMFSSEVKMELSEAELEDLWESLTHSYGAYSGFGESMVKKYKENFINYTLMKFEKLPLYLKLVYNKEMQIAGIFYEPAQRENDYVRPDYADYNRIRELKMNLINGDYEMPAVLTLPKGTGPFPVIILVHGSGPHDMDETVGPNKPFKDLALGLASQGVAVFRYDKRSKVYGPEMAAENITIHDEVTDDAMVAIKLLKTIPETDTSEMYVLGHSLGGMMAPEIARRSPGLKGIVLMAAPARHLLEMLNLQLDNMIAANKGKSDSVATMQLLEMKKQVNLANSDQLTTDTDSKLLPFKIPAEYWISLKNYDHQKVTKSLSLKILVMQAEKDQQVFMKDYELWKQGIGNKKNVDFKLYEGLNHLFLLSKDDNVEEDYKIRGSVSEQAVNDIANWILK